MTLVLLLPFGGPIGDLAGRRGGAGCSRCRWRPSSAACCSASRSWPRCSPLGRCSASGRPMTERRAPSSRRLAPLVPRAGAGRRHRSSRRPTRCASARPPVRRSSAGMRRSTRSRREPVVLVALRPRPRHVRRDPADGARRARGPPGARRPAGLRQPHARGPGAAASPSWLASLATRSSTRPACSTSASCPAPRPRSCRSPGRPSLPADAERRDRAELRDRGDRRRRRARSSSAATTSGRGAGSSSSRRASSALPVLPIAPTIAPARDPAVPRRRPARRRCSPRPRDGAAYRGDGRRSARSSGCARPTAPSEHCRSSSGCSPPSLVLGQALARAHRGRAARRQAASTTAHERPPRDGAGRRRGHLGRRGRDDRRARRACSASAGCSDGRSTSSPASRRASSRCSRSPRSSCRASWRRSADRRGRIAASSGSGSRLVGATAGAPWLPRVVAAVPISIAHRRARGVRARRRGDRHVPAAAGGDDRRSAGSSPLRSSPRRRGGASSPASCFVGFPARRAPWTRALATAIGGRPRGCSLARHRGLARLPAPLAARPAAGPHRLPRRRLAGARPMSVAVDTELALLIDVGSAWAKASVIGRVRGRWRLVTSRGAADGVGRGGAASVARGPSRAHRSTRGSPDRAGRAARVSANRIECHTARRPAASWPWPASRESCPAAPRAVPRRPPAGRSPSSSPSTTAARSPTGSPFSRRSRPTAGSSPAASTGHAARAPCEALPSWPRRAGADRLRSDLGRAARSWPTRRAALFEPERSRPCRTCVPMRAATIRRRCASISSSLLRTVVRARGRDRHLAAIALPRAVGALAAASGLRILAVDIGARGAISALAEPDGSVDEPHPRRRRPCRRRPPPRARRRA